MNSAIQASVNACRDALRGDGDPSWTKVWSYIQIGKCLMSPTSAAALAQYEFAVQPRTRARRILFDDARGIDFSAHTASPRPEGTPTGSRAQVKMLRKPGEQGGPWPVSLGCTTNSYSSINPSSAKAWGDTLPSKSPLPALAAERLLQIPAQEFRVPIDPVEGARDDVLAARSGQVISRWPAPVSCLASVCACGRAAP